MHASESYLAKQVLSRRKGTETGEQEAAYLYGFLDPQMAARGPMRSEHPTVMATLSSTTTLTLKGPKALPETWPYGAYDTGLVHMNGTAGDQTGDATVVAGPVVFIDK